MRRTIPYVLILFGLVAAPVAGADETAYEEPPEVVASELLDAAEIKGPNHTVADVVRTRRFMHRFDVTSTYGRYDAGSKAMLDIRVREIETMARVVDMEGAPEFFRSLGGRLAQIPTAAVEILINPEDSFKKMGDELERTWGRIKDLFEPRRGSAAEDSKAREALIGVEKRKLAVELGLDVYSTNPKVQEFLNEIAGARTAGGAGVDLATFALPLAGYLVVATARLRADVTRLLRDKTPAELERHNAGVLTDAGVSQTSRQTFLEQAWLSPRHQTVIAAAIRDLEGVEGVAAVAQAAGLSRSEIGALYHEQQAVLLSHHHASVEPLAQMVAVRHVVAARTQSGRAVVVLPVDQVYWMSDFETLVRDLTALPLLEGTTRRQILVTGRVTDRAKTELEKLGFEVTARYEPVLETGAQPK